MKNVCRRRGCKSRHPKALWMVDRVPYCNHCFEQWATTHYLDEHVVVRLSNFDNDFPERDYIRQQDSVPA